MTTCIGSTGPHPGEREGAHARPTPHLQSHIEAFFVGNLEPWPAPRVTVIGLVVIVALGIAALGARGATGMAGPAAAQAASIGAGAG